MKWTPRAPEGEGWYWWRQRTPLYLAGPEYDKGIIHVTKGPLGYAEFVPSRDEWVALPPYWEWSSSPIAEPEER